MNNKNEELSKLELLSKFLKEPNLAPPGAGIPLPMKLVLRFFVSPFVAGKSDWDKNFMTLDKLHKKILIEVQSLSEADLQKKILVPPQKGLEDSSRYWSIKMTIEHLLIVGTQMKEVIISLSEGNVPIGKADTAKVKPLGLIDGKVVLAQYQEFAQGVIDELNSRVKNRNTSTKFLHPWFGLMNNLQWQWLIAMHSGIHLKQIREIKKKLILT